MDDETMEEMNRSREMENDSFDFGVWEEEEGKKDDMVLDTLAEVEELVDKVDNALAQKKFEEDQSDEADRAMQLIFSPIGEMVVCHGRNMDILLTYLFETFKRHQVNNTMNWRRLMIFLHERHPDELYSFIICKNAFEILLTNISHPDVWTVISLLVKVPYVQKRRGKKTPYTIHETRRDDMYRYLANQVGFFHFLFYKMISSDNPDSRSAKDLFIVLFDRLLCIIENDDRFEKDQGIYKLYETLFEMNSYVRDVLELCIDEETPECTKRNALELLTHILTSTKTPKTDVEIKQVISGDPRKKLFFRIHHFFMEQVSEQFNTLLKLFTCEYDRGENKKNQISSKKGRVSSDICFSAYEVKTKFGALRMNLVKIFILFENYMLVNCDISPLMMHYELVRSDEADRIICKNLRKNHKNYDAMDDEDHEEKQRRMIDIFQPLVQWFFDFPFNNMYHFAFKKIIKRILLLNEKESIRHIFLKHKLIDKLVQTYLMDDTDSKGTMFDLFLLFQERINKIPSHFISKFCSTNKSWKDFEPILREKVTNSGLDVNRYFSPMKVVIVNKNSDDDDDDEKERCFNSKNDDVESPVNLLSLFEELEKSGKIQEVTKKYNEQYLKVHFRNSDHSKFDGWNNYSFDNNNNNNNNNDNNNNNNNNNNDNNNPFSGSLKIKPKYNNNNIAFQKNNKYENITFDDDGDFEKVMRGFQLPQSGAFSSLSIFEDEDYYGNSNKEDNM